MARPLASLLVAAALAACAHAPAAGPGAAAEVTALDAAWARTVAGGDRDGFRALVAQDALFAGRRLLRGREEVWAAWSAFFAEGGPRISWAPAAAGAAGSDDLAWTTGSFRLERRGENGATVTSEGRYLTVWSRGAGGAWRVVLDGGLEPGVPPAPIERETVREIVSGDGKLAAAMGTWRQAGAQGVRAGAWVTVRERAGGAWRTLAEGGVEFPRPAPP